MSSAVSAPRTTDLSEYSSLAPGETCSTLAISPPGLETSCRAWRSCRSCLQKTGCAVSASNLCVSQSDPAFRDGSTADYRNALKLNDWQFPAIETSYCAVDDAVCTQFKQASFYLPGGVADSRFCVGQGGCVCIFNCEVVGGCARVAGRLRSSHGAGGDHWPSWLAQRSDMTGTLLAVLIVPICTLLVLAVWNSIRQRLRVENNASERTLPRRLVTGEQVEIEEVVLEVSNEKQHDQKLSNDESLAGDEGKDATHVAQLCSAASSSSKPTTQTSL